jgi:hypothetical protein
MFRDVINPQPHFQQPECYMYKVSRVVLNTLTAPFVDYLFLGRWYCPTDSIEPSNRSATNLQTANMVNKSQLTDSSNRSDYPIVPSS